MSSQMCRLLLVTIVCSMPIVALQAQDNTFRLDPPVDRVINLHSSEAPIPPTIGRVEQPARSSRTERLAKKPTAFQDPSQIQYDEITTRARAGKPTLAARKEVAQSSSSIQQPFVNRNMEQVRQETGLTGSATTGSAFAKSTPLVVSTMTPQISTKVTAPKFVNLGQPTTIKIQLKNTGQLAAQNVSLIAKLPTHARFTSARPAPSSIEGQLFKFNVGLLGTRQVKEFIIEIVPTEKQPLEIATQIQVMDQQQFEVSVRQPELKIDVSGPDHAKTGEWIRHFLTITNIGDGIAENVRLVREQPAAFHVDESQNGFSIRRIEPGETKRIEMKSFAQSAGEFDLAFAVTSNNLDPQKLTHPMTVFQPELQVSATGPNMNFVNRDGIYTIQLDNSGQVDITNVSVALEVPEGFEVTTVNLQAKIDKQTGRLTWAFDEISAKSTKTIQLKAVSTIPGRQVCTIVIRSNETRGEQIQLITQVDSRADVSINLTNQGGPVEVGGTTEFVINVLNQGSSLASAVEVQVELADALAPVVQEYYAVNESDNTIRFTALEIAPGETKEYRIRVVGVGAGEHVVRSIVRMNGSERSLISEGSVFVFETNQSRVSESLEPTIRRR